MKECKTDNPQKLFNNLILTKQGQRCPYFVEDNNYELKGVIYNCYNLND